MAKISTLILLLTTLTTSFCQKIKTEWYDVDYIKPPKSELTITKNYTWRVTELTYTPNFRKIETKYNFGDLNYGRGQFFATYTNLGSVPGFKAPQKGIKFNADGQLLESSIIEVLIGTAEIIEIITVDGGKINPNQAASPSAQAFNVRIHVPLSFDMQYAKKKEGFNENSNINNVHFTSIYNLNEEALSFNHTFRFPKDFKALKNVAGYSTKAELDKVFTSYKRAFLKEMKDRIIVAFLKKAKLEVESLYCSAKRDLDVRLNYVKDKEGNYPEFEKWTTTFKKVETLIKANIEAKNKMNWFTPEAKSILANLLTEQGKYAENKERPLLIKTAVNYNLIWLYFFNSEFDLALNQIDNLLTLKADLKEKLQKSNSQKDKSLRISKEEKKETNATIGIISIKKLTELKEIITDFKIRYNINKEKLGW